MKAKGVDYRKGRVNLTGEGVLSRRGVFVLDAFGWSGLIYSVPSAGNGSKQLY